ncbi:hypothetical protein PhCBS80983_g06424, partial [Powellomyces hirtus]
SRADDLTLKFLTARLLHEETRRPEGQDGGGKDGGAFYGRSRIGNTSMKKTAKPCFYCGKEGHFKKECRKRLEAEQQSSKHMTSNRAWLSNLQPLNNASVHLPDNRMVEATEKGTATIQTALSNGRTTTCTFKDVWLVPKLEGSLLLVAQLEGAGANIQFVGGRCEIRTSKGTLALICNRREGLYALGQPLDTAAQCHAVPISTTAATLKTGHRCLGLSIIRASSLWPGRAWSRAWKQQGHKAALPQGGLMQGFRSLGTGASDISGQMRMLKIGGARYFVLFIDDKSRAFFPYLLKTKAETLPSFKIFAAAAATETGCSLKVLQSDYGGEYLSKAFSNFTQSLGIRHQLSSVATPEQNAGLLYKFWREALMTAAYLWNRSPTQALHNKATPWQIWTGTRPNIQHLCTFGCTAYASILKKNQHKLGPNATRCIFLGYSQTTKGYQLRDVRFDEELLAGDPGKPDPIRLT